MYSKVCFPNIKQNGTSNQQDQGILGLTAKTLVSAIPDNQQQQSSIEKLSF